MINKIEVKKSLSRDIPLITGITQELFQVFMNCGPIYTIFPSTAAIIDAVLVIISVLLVVLLDSMAKGNDELPKEGVVSVFEY